MDSISELSIVKDYDKSKEKAKLEENARKEAEKNEAEKRRVEEERAKIQHQNDTKASEETQIISPKFCENCGEPIKSGAKFCTNCGAEIRCVKSVTQGMLDEQNLKIIKINPFSSEAEAEDNVTVDKEEIDSVPQSSATTSDATLKEDAEQVNIDEDIAQCNDNAEDDDLESGKILKQETDI